MTAGHTLEAARLAGAGPALALLVAAAVGLGLGAVSDVEDRSRQPAARDVRLPVGALGAISRALGRDAPGYRVVAAGGGLRARNARHGLRARFSPDGVRVRSSGSRLGLSLRAYGYGSALSAVGAVVPVARANEVSYRHGGIEEWWANGPAGLEQGFTLRSRPAHGGGGPLTLALALSGDLRPTLERGGDGLALRSGSGRASLRYTGLFASDARGRELPARLELRGNRVLIRVDDAGARYPLQVDPFVQQAKLTASDGAVLDELGRSVAVSGDTVVAGVQADNVGANSEQGSAYVFVKPPSGWANATETAKLTASDGASGDEFGISVAISGDTVVAGAHQHNAPLGDQGSVYVFVKPPAGWATGTETAKLTASDAATGDNLGESVAISGDTVVAGASDDFVGGAATGSAYVFVKPPAGWASGTQTAKLTASDGASGDDLGLSIAVSGDTVVAGAPDALVGGNGGQGAAYVFVKPPAGWATGTQTAKLTASDGAAGDELGFSVAVSGDTVVAGAWQDGVGANFEQGSAYVFVKPPAGWASGTQTAKLTASDGAADDNLGQSVAVSNGTLLAGAPGDDGARGSAYLFEQPPSGWADGTETEKLTASDGAAVDSFGESVAVSGEAVVAGAPDEGEAGVQQRGSAYVFGSGGDTTPPDTTIDSGPSGVTGDNTPQFSFSSSEAGSSFQCRVDGAAFAACGSPFTAPALADGAHTFEVSAIDPAANVDPSAASRSFTVDTSAPAATIGAGPTGPITDSTPTFEFTSGDPEARFECSVDGAAFAACASPFSLPRLASGRHTFEVRALDGAGNAGPSVSAIFELVGGEPSSPPVLGTSMNVVPLSGEVLVSLPGGGGEFIPLSEARQIPVGSLLDTRRGSVRLTSATGAAAATQAGTFAGGVFQILQSRRRSARGLTELRLTGSSFSRCRRRRSAGAAQLSRRTIRRLRSNATGRFRTRGRHSAATVRGTTWTVTDRCDGTLTTVRRGKVAVRDFKRRKTVVVRAGKSYLASARR